MSNTLDINIFSHDSKNHSILIEKLKDKNLRFSILFKEHPTIKYQCPFSLNSYISNFKKIKIHKDIIKNCSCKELFGLTNCDEKMIHFFIDVNLDDTDIIYEKLLCDDISIDTYNF